MPKNFDTIVVVLLNAPTAQNVPFQPFQTQPLQFQTKFFENVGMKLRLLPAPYKELCLSRGCHFDEHVFSLAALNIYRGDREQAAARCGVKGREERGEGRRGTGEKMNRGQHMKVGGLYIPPYHQITIQPPPITLPTPAPASRPTLLTWIGHDEHGKCIGFGCGNTHLFCASVVGVKLMRCMRKRWSCPSRSEKGR